MPLRLLAAFILCMFSVSYTHAQQPDPAVLHPAIPIPHPDTLHLQDSVSITSLDPTHTSTRIRKDTPWLRFKRVLPYWDLWRTKKLSSEAAADQDENSGRISGMTPAGFVWRAVITYNPPIYPLYRLLREIIRVPAFHARHRHRKSTLSWLGRPRPPAGGTVGLSGVHGTPSNP